MLKNEKMSKERKMYLSNLWKGKRKGKNNPHWKIGKWIDKDGYVMVYAPNHPHATYGRYIRKHRLIMEKYLGRYLEPKEVIHHINGNKSDNHLENLILIPNHGIHISKHNTGKHRNKRGQFVD